jgi:hypothetical protein
VPVVGEGAEVVDVDLDEAGGDGAAENAVGEDALKEIRKDGDEIEAHRWECRISFFHGVGNGMRAVAIIRAQEFAEILAYSYRG